MVSVAHQNSSQKNICIENVVIISDFDGTITCQDVNDIIFRVFGNENLRKIERELKMNKIGDREALRRYYSKIKLSERKFNRYIYNTIKIDPYFRAFYDYIKKNNIKFAIVSGGFRNYIDLLFEKYDIQFEHDIYTNRLYFKGNTILPQFLHEIIDCKIQFGPCGNCKKRIIGKYSGKKIIYIGDGLTDRCIAGVVDILLAKENSFLLKFAKNNNISYLCYKNFNDVQEYIQKFIKEGIIQ